MALQVELGFLNAMTGKTIGITESGKWQDWSFLDVFDSLRRKLSPGRAENSWPNVVSRRLERTNQVQAIRHSLVATSRIVGHRPRLPRHQQSLGTFSYKFKLSSQLCREHVGESVSCGCSAAFNGQILWFGSTMFSLDFQSLEGSIWQAISEHVWMFACGARLKWWGQRRS